MNEEVISQIKGIIDEWYFEPAANWNEYYFTERSYQRWAAEEIINRLRLDNPKNPKEIIVRFMKDMDNFSEIGKNATIRFKFVVAYETSRDIFYALYEEGDDAYVLY